MSLGKLKSICEAIEKRDKDEPKNKKFYALNLHGYELEDDFKVPKNVRIVMFCYSGRKLFVCPRFDRFNWYKIFMNKDATFNYCTFLASISQYASLRDHFCVYNTGDTIKNMRFNSDENFRDGLFKLPIEAAVLDYEENEVYRTSGSLGNGDMPLDDDTTFIKDSKEVANRLQDKSNYAHFTSFFEPKVLQSLKDISMNLTFKEGGVTLFLLTCREGKSSKLKHTKRVYEELREMYERYERDIGK